MSAPDTHIRLYYYRTPEGTIGLTDDMDEAMALDMDCQERIPESEMIDNYFPEMDLEPLEQE